MVLNVDFDCCLEELGIGALEALPSLLELPFMTVAAMLVKGFSRHPPTTGGLAAAVNFFVVDEELHLQRDNFRGASKDPAWTAERSGKLQVRLSSSTKLAVRCQIRSSASGFS